MPKNIMLLGVGAIIDRELSTKTAVRLPDSLTVRFTSVYWETDGTFLYTTGITGPIRTVHRRLILDR